MHRLQELIRLHRLGRSQREIAGQLRMARKTIRRHSEALAKAGVLAGSADDLPDPEVLREVVAEHLPGKPAAQQASTVADWESTVVELLAQGAGPTAIHDHLRLNSEGFRGSLSSIKRICLRLTKSQGPSAADVAIPVDTAPGEVGQVDFGYVGMCYDKDQGVLRKAWLFVLTLGFSRHMYCDIVFDQKVGTWCQLHIRAFEFLGGVPKVIVPDNLKSAVIRGAFGVDDRADLNRTYCELARHYGFQVDPAPPRAPKKKGKVERSIRYVKGNFFKTWKTRGLQEDRKQLTRWNMEIAATRVHGTTGKAPLSLFEDREQKTLLPLPRRPWEWVTWRQSTVHVDCHVQVDGAFYSVPWQHIGQKLWVQTSAKTVSIYRDDAILYVHARAKRGKRQLIPSHLPEERRDLRFRSQSYWETRSEALGSDVARLVKAVFDSEDVLLQLRKVQAIVKHLEGFPRERANHAAARALHFGSLSYFAVKNILSKGLDYEPFVREPARAWSKGSKHARGPSLPFDNEEIPPCKSVTP